MKKTLFILPIIIICFLFLNQKDSSLDYEDFLLSQYKNIPSHTEEELKNIPKKGPVVIVSNHPFGILDGLIMGYVLSHARKEFKIIANRVFRKARDLDDVILPISFEENREGNIQNLNTRNEAINYLKKGGIVGIFPGGTVATSAKLFSKASDPHWKRFTSKLILKSKATVIPVFLKVQIAGCSR